MQNDLWANDSVFVQFDGTVDSTGTPLYRIGTTSSTTVNLEDCSGCGLHIWGWQDNGWETGVLGPVLRFRRADCKSSGSSRERTGCRSIRLCCRRKVPRSSRHLQAR